MTTTSPAPIWVQAAADAISPPGDGWIPEPHQIPPEDFFIWGLMGGRGCGKTATMARYVHEHVMGPACLPGIPGGHWIGIIGPTLGDAVTSCVNGPSGLRKWDPGIKVRQTAGGTSCRWSNGAEAKLFGAHTPDDVERLRSGGNRCLVWAEELAAWRYMEESWQHMRYGLRVGPRPRAVFSTTPKNRKLIKKLFEDSKSGHKRRTYVAGATTDDNPHLSKDVREMLYEDYGGTRLGQQELFGKILDDVKGALWTLEVIEKNRISMEELPPLDLIVVGVDPQALDNPSSDETGIAVAGIKNYWRPRSTADTPNRDIPKMHGFVLGDYSIKGLPQLWARASHKAYNDWSANFMVAEVNNGGEMVRSTIQTEFPNVPVMIVHATRGKMRRAEPVSFLYEQNRVHHVGMFPHIEDQMTGWDATDPPDDWSPDRMDALVWALTKLMVGQITYDTGKQRDTRLDNRR